VFKLKLDEFMHDLMHIQVMGRLAGISMVVEYQKHMLPHAHSVVIIHPDDRDNTAEDIDKLVSAEISRETTDAENENTTDYLIWAITAVVIHNMDHGPCGADNNSDFLAKFVGGDA
jgi:hypothetical protein